MFDNDFFDDYPIDYEDDYDMNAVAATDMTGLIPSAPETGSEMAQYEDIYPYGPDYDEYALLEE